MTKTMFEKTALTVLVESKAGYKEVPVYEMDKELYCQNGGYFLRIKLDGKTSNLNLRWVKFSNGKVPTFNTIGWAMASKKWKKEPARTQIKRKHKSSEPDSTNVPKV